MNTASVSAAITRLTVVSFAAAAMLLANPLNSKANDSKDKVTPVSAKQVSVTYTGTKDNSVVFRVQFHNPTAQKFSFLIKNHTGDILFSGQYTDREFSKTILLLKEENEMNPSFIIRTDHQTIENRFAVSTQVDRMEEVVVTRL